MYWKKKKLTYNIFIPPIDKPFEKLSPKEAKEHFNWYVGNIAGRIDYLQETSKIALDFSESSLISIWKWFLFIAEIEKTPKAKIKEVENQLINHPREIAKAVIKDEKYQFSLQTEYILRDIAMYLGQVFITNHPQISLGYHTDISLDSSANMPILLGFVDKAFKPPFDMIFEPIHMSMMQASKLFDKTHSQDDIYNLYKKWVQWIPKN